MHVLNLSELGITNSIVYSMYKPIAEDDNDKLCALMAFYRKIYFAIGVFILTVGVLCIPFLPNLIKGDYPPGINIYVLYIIYLLNTVISYFFFGYKEAVLTAYQRIDLINAVRLLSFLLQFVFQIIILVIIRDYYIYAGMMIIFTLLRGYVNSVLVSRRYPQIKCSGTIDKEELNTIKVNMAGVTLGKLCTISRGSFDEIIMSSFLGLSALAIFDNYYYIISAIVAVMNVVENSLISGVGNSIVTDSVDKNYDDYKKISFIYMWIVGTFSCCLFSLYQPFMALWVGDKLMIDDITMTLFVFYYYSGCLCSISNVYSTAKGLWWKLKVKSIFEIIVNLSLNLILVNILGMRGIIIATIISYVFVSFFWGSNILFKEYFGKEHFISLLFTMLGHTILTVAVCIMCYYSVHFITVGNVYVNMFFRLCVATVLSSLVYFIAFSRTKYVKYMNSIIAMMIKPFTKRGGK